MNSMRRRPLHTPPPTLRIVTLTLATFLIFLGSDTVGAAAADATPGRRGERKSTQARERPGVDTAAVWRAETEVFTPEQLMKLEPILRASTCRNEKTGCTYLDNGRPGSEASFAFRLIPWAVSRHRGYLVRNDRCAPGGCDEGLFVLIDGRWRLLTETFGILERASSTTLGFSDLVFRPRGKAPVRLVWDGRGYREVWPSN
jgi:hypothetical protein